MIVELTTVEMNKDAAPPQQPPTVPPTGSRHAPAERREPHPTAIPDMVVFAVATSDSTGAGPAHSLTIYASNGRVTLHLDTQAVEQLRARLAALVSSAPPVTF